MSTWTTGDRWHPGSPKSRRRTRRLKRECGDHLRRWDPIGLAAWQDPRDEYDAYISPLLHLLHGGASEDEVADYLGNVVEQRMSLPAEPARERRTAAELVVWWQQATG